MATKKRTSKRQFSIYLKYLEDHPVLLNGKLHPHNTPEDIKLIWDDLSLSLNACGDGPVRTSNEWKKIFTEWKSSIRKKAREDKVLNDLENKLIHLSGTGAVTGLLQIPELGQDLEAAADLEETNENSNAIEHERESESAVCGENIVIEVVEQESSSKKKRVRRTTGDVLTDAYQKSSADQRSGLESIASAIADVANAINRYCDIIEKK